MAAILDAILNFSKRSRVPGVHPVDSERVDPRLPKSIQKKTLHKISRFSQKIGFGNRPTIQTAEDIVLTSLSAW